MQAGFGRATLRCILIVHSRAIGARSTRVTGGLLSFPIATLPLRSSKSAITEGPLT